MVKSALQLLIGARALISDPKHWTQKTYARDSAGHPTEYYGVDADCFCSSGALKCFAGDNRDDTKVADSEAEHIKALKYLTKAMADDIITFNDNRTHPEVLAAWDVAIAMAEVHTCRR